MEQKGTISIHTENIFPIIKRALYADTEVFIRELASNGVDACRKAKQVGPVEGVPQDDEKLWVDVRVDKEARTITFSDTGIGMTADEVEKYITQIAFSGASEFLEKFSEQGAKREDIIGAFGLGFYSAFMVADKVEIVTKSLRPGSEAVRWVCEGQTEYTITAAERESQGTDVILHVSADSEEFLDADRVKSVLTKYCRFLPVTVKFDGEAINQKALWVRNPAELTDQDYLDFHKSLYPYAEEPLFWIHLNVDHPFTLTGILYFPKMTGKFEVEREKIQLYSRQVFITENLKDVVPDFLSLLHGVIDSPDIPLNVSRSALQSDASVKKIGGYITRKVADKLNELFTQDRAGYEAKWEAVGFFVKYGLVAEPKFAERAKNFTLLKNTEGKLFTLAEYREKTAPAQTDKEGTLIWLYTPDAARQAAFMAPLTARGYDVLDMSHPIDSHYVSHLEQLEEKIRIKRIDSGTADEIIAKDETTASILTDEEKEKLKTIFTTELGDKVTVKTADLQSTDLPAALVQDEFMLRMAEMMKLQGQASMFGDMPGQLVLNANHPAMGAILTADEASAGKKARHLYQLALLAQGKLEGTALADFITASATMMA